MTHHLLVTGEVTELTGVNLRRLDHWVKQGYVKPRGTGWGSGSHRLWSDEDVARVREIDEVYRRAAAMFREAGLRRPW